MFVLFCACDVMNVLSVKKKKGKFTKKQKKNNNTSTKLEFKVKYEGY
jgi:hypothetical protein